MTHSFVNACVDAASRGLDETAAARARNTVRASETHLAHLGENAATQWWDVRSAGRTLDALCADIERAGDRLEQAGPDTLGDWGLAPSRFAVLAQLDTATWRALERSPPWVARGAIATLSARVLGEGPCAWAPALASRAAARLGFGPERCERVAPGQVERALEEWPLSDHGPPLGALGASAAAGTVISGSWGWLAATLDERAGADPAIPNERALERAQHDAERFIKQYAVKHLNWAIGARWARRSKTLADAALTRASRTALGAIQARWSEVPGGRNGAGFTLTPAPARTARHNAGWGRPCAWRADYTDATVFLACSERANAADERRAHDAALLTIERDRGHPTVRAWIEGGLCETSPRRREAAARAIHKIIAGVLAPHD